MSNATHTPGPWHLAKCEDGIVFAIAGGDESRFRSRALLKMTTSVNDTEEQIAEQNANARLIAAAPETAAERDRLKEVNAELLEVVRVCREREYNPFEPDNQSALYHRLEALEARAKGETA